jgi:gluconolactonase
VYAETVFRLPDRYRVTSRYSEFSAVQFSGGQVDSFLEGPSFDRIGNLYCVDIPWGRIFRARPGGELELVAEYDGWPTGLKIHKDGRIFVADFKHGIMICNPDSGLVQPLLTSYRLEGFKGCNDLFFASNGDLYFSDQGQTGLHDPTGRVFRLSADGRLTLLADYIPAPNGLVLNFEESKLYVASTRANAIWQLPLMDGGVGKAGTFIQLSGGRSGPDGLAIASNGSLAIAHAGLGTVWIFDELGEPMYRIKSRCGLFTTNLAFHPIANEIYVTESETGTILKAELSISGKLMFSHQ